MEVPVFDSDSACGSPSPCWFLLPVLVRVRERWRSNALATPRRRPSSRPSGPPVCAKPVSNPSWSAPSFPEVIPSRYPACDLSKTLFVVEDVRGGKLRGAYILEARGEPGPLRFCRVRHSFGWRVFPGRLINILHIDDGKRAKSVAVRYSTVSIFDLTCIRLFGPELPI